MTAPKDNPGIIAALAAAQGEFPAIERNKTAQIQGKNGSAGYSYSYADIADVLAAVRPVLSKHRLAITQRTKQGEGGKTDLITELHHADGGEPLVSEVEIGASSGNPQAFGASLTYLRRYEMSTLLGIAPEDDRDAQDVEPQRANGNGTPAWARPATDANKKKMIAVLAEQFFDGNERQAKLYAKALTDSIGGFPGVFAEWIAALPIWQASARDAAAEPAQPGTPDDGDDRKRQPTPEEIEAEREATEAAQAEAAQAEAEDGDAGPAPEELTPDAVEDGPVAASLDDTEENREACTCKDPPPVGGDVPDDAGEDDVDPQCPIKGHGIPF